MVKQESQRREREVSAPARSLESSTEVQKQVGQTMVQLPQVRQRSATSSQRGCSRLRRRSSCRSSACISRPMLAAVRATTASAAATSSRVAARCGSSARTARPASVAASTRKQMLALDEKLGQREIEAGLGLRPGLHRDAKTGAARLAAIDGDDEGALRAAPGSADRHARRRETPGPGWRSRGARRRARR